MKDSQTPGRAGATNAAFPSSCWTAVLNLKPGGNDTLQQHAFAQLCERYWFPLYAFARHRGKTSHDAEDIVQSFFTQICNADYFGKADQDKGKLRTFILTGFTRHMKDLRVHAAALKRGNGIVPISINTEQAEEWLLTDPKSQGDDATLNFERLWATNLVRAVVETLGQRAGDGAKSRQRFEVLSRFLMPQTCDDFSTKEAADELGMSVAACEKAIQRLRHQFRIEVREQVAATLANPSEDAIMGEMQQLQKSLLSC